MKIEILSERYRQRHKLTLKNNKMRKLLRQKLYDKYTKEELIEMVNAKIYINDSKKDTELSHAITMKLEDEKKLNGTYQYCGGYSGRQTKRGIG